MSALILVVIAEPESRANWKQLLEDHGYQTVAIATGERVLDLCAHLRPDMVLMGASLPDGPGREVYRRMKDDPRSRLTPVILIEDFEEDRSSTYKSGHGSTHESGGDDVWGPRPTRWEALTRVQSLIQIKSYIDEQAEAVVLSLAHTIEARDAYTHGHSARLAVSAVELAEKLGLSHDLVETLRIAAIVHDIGKVGVPDSVLLKAGPLSAQEMSIIRRHPVEGERICSPLKSLQIVDIYDALTTDRPYRKAYTPTQAIGTLYSEAERGWVDMDLVQVFAPAGAMPKSAISGFTQGAEKMRGIS
jgi:putative two-component system response regulator